MPRGKKGRKNKFNESAITTRLIQISLKMDNHCYSDQLVTRSEAANYLQEISALKLRCLPTNVRDLQVIEKLTRFMTFILNDGDDHTSNSHHQSFQMTYGFARSASPVYSLPDEDRNINSPNQNDLEDLNITNVTYKEMDITNVTDNVATDNEINIPSKHIKTVDITNLTYNKNIIDTEVIDISDDSEIEQGIQTVSKNYLHNISIERVNTGISTMTLQDKDGSLTQCDDNICSQSILDNYDNDITNEVVREKDRTKGVEMVSHGANNAKTHITNDVNKYCQINTPLVAMVSDATIADPKLMASQPKNIVDVNRKPVHQHSHFPENTDKEKKVTNKNNNKLKKRRITKKNKELKVDNAVNSKHVSIGYNGKENNLKTIKKSKNRKKVTEIYNGNVENDLSWVENIRFVREISPSEYDPALTILKDNFWDNFELPDTWDDLDFSV